MDDQFVLAYDNAGGEKPADSSGKEAREHMAFANTMSGCSMVTGCCTSEHALEHAMSADLWELPPAKGIAKFCIGCDVLPLPAVQEDGGQVRKGWWISG